MTFLFILQGRHKRNDRKPRVHLIARQLNKWREINLKSSGNVSIFHLQHFYFYTKQTFQLTNQPIKKIFLNDNGVQWSRFQNTKNKPFITANIFNAFKNKSALNRNVVKRDVADIFLYSFFFVYFAFFLKSTIKLQIWNTNENLAVFLNLQYNDRGNCIAFAWD